MSDVGDEYGNRKARWIRVCVDAFDNDALDKGPFDRRSAWLWLIANAAWQDRRINHKGRPLLLKRGQVLAGRSFLAKKWQWGEQSVRTFLNVLQSEHMIETNQSDGHYANVLTVCNYEKYQTPQPRTNQTNNQSLTRAQPEPNQTFTTYTSSTIERDDTRERVSSPPNAISKTESEPPRREVFGLPNGEQDRRVALENGRLVLFNGLRQEWLEMFGGDEGRLTLALTEAAGVVQTNSFRPLEAQVSAQLARIVARKRDSDARYASAVQSNKQQPQFRKESPTSSMERAIALAEKAEADRAKLMGKN